MRTTANRPIYRSRWWMPGFSFSLGLIMLVAFWVGGNLGDGLISLGIMTFVAAIFLFGTRSETLQGLGGPGRDERWAMIDVHATALTGLVLITVIIGAWLVEVAGGEDGSPYGGLGAVGGIAYVVIVAILRRRA
jgi:hypothetical protein